MGEPRYQQLFESSPLPLWVYDLETLHFLDVNEVACAKYGYSREEFLRMTILDIRPPEDTGAVIASVRYTPTMTFSSGVWRHRLKSGELINVEVTSHEMLFMGRLTRFVCPIDVTQRLRTEAILRRREEALRRAQALAGLAHIWIAPDGKLEDASENMPCLTGVGFDGLPPTLGLWIESLVHVDDRKAMRAKAEEALKTLERVEMEYRLVRPDGAVLQVAQVLEPIESAERPQDRRWFSTVQDVTEQRRAERVLEERVRERTLELETSNRELARATAQAEQASLAKSRFLSTVSHELRTPLNAILGFAQLLDMSGSLEAERQSTFVEHISKAGNHLLALINELLDLASIEAGKTSMSIEPLKLSDVLADCESLIGPIAAQRGIELHAAADVRTRVEGDRTRLRQVLINLVSNAVKYSPVGAQVDVRCDQIDGWVRISVIDRGAGMSPEQVASLYQPFNRLGREAGQTKGTGIGLVVSKSLIELMNGRIGVDSIVGSGSTFWIELPGTSRDEADPSPFPRAAALSQSTARTNGFSGADDTGLGQAQSQSIVLCVDDDLSSLRVIEQVLALRPAITILTASNGRMGVELARLHKPAVIIMDNKMPEMTGNEARAILRANPSTALTPIIALSGEVPTMLTNSGEGDVFRVLSKPLEVQLILRAVDDALAAAARPSTGLKPGCE